VDGAGKLDGGGSEHLGDIDRAGTHAVDAIEDEAAGGASIRVDYVVHGAAEFVHVSRSKG